MANLDGNKTIQNIREFLETQITPEKGLYHIEGVQEVKLYNVKVIWGGDTYYIGYSYSNDAPISNFLPINATTISQFKLKIED